LEIIENQSGAKKPKMGFWKCWAMSVGVMIGSGVFLLPTVLAPFGAVSFLGWIATSSAAIIIALILGRLASRTDRTGQLVTTILKLIPLGVIIVLGLTVGTPENIPQFNPQGQSIFGAVAATAMLTMWAFVGLEAGTVAAGDVIDPKRTIPRAIVAGTLTVTFVYIAATAAVMMLVPVDILKTSEAPFVDAAKALGPIGGGNLNVDPLYASALCGFFDCRISYVPKVIKRMGAYSLDRRCLCGDCDDRLWS